MFPITLTSSSTGILVGTTQPIIVFNTVAGCADDDEDAAVDDDDDDDDPAVFFSHRGHATPITCRSEMVRWGKK